MKCLVTGATGFIGRVLCRELLAQGDEVVALSRQAREVLPGLGSVGIDLAVQEIPRELLSNVDVVFHLAGIAHQQATPDQYDALNYRAPLRLAQMARDAGVGRFIFLSSVKAMGPPRDGSVRSETDITAPGDAYGLSKQQAEQALVAEFADSAMAVIIVRPALVYGVGVKGNLQRLAAAVRRGLPCPPEGGRRSMISVGDLVGLLQHLARFEVRGVNTWIACGAGSYSTRALYGMMRSALGLPVARGRLPRGLWWLGARALDLFAGNSGEATYHKLFAAELYSNQRVVADTGWKPQERLEELMPALVEAST